MKPRLFYFLSILTVLFIIHSCARRGKPTGGAKDITAPIIITADPDHESIHFDSDKIELNFDEYVKLKDVNKQLVISPPMKHQPEISPIGTANTTITIKILDTLKENTTYTFNFGNSIVDNNEGNPLESFKYVFSTGDYIDSLTISGTVSDAYNHKPDENISIQLYEITENYTDSIIYKEQPSYVANTLDSINFDLTNLKSGDYLMIALRDVSNNYRFDPKQDKIAFHPQIISLPSDTLDFNLTLFKEIPSYQIMRPAEVKQGHIYFGYQGDAEGININLISDKPDDFKSTLVFEEGKDTVSYWYSPIEVDSLLFEIKKDKQIDTLMVRLRSKEVDSLDVSGATGVLKLRDTFAISTNIPIQRIDRTKISIMDSDSTNVDFTTIMAKNKMKFTLNFKKKYNDKYKIQLLPNAIEDLYGNVNDTLYINTSTKHPDDYGNIGITLQNAESYPLILEILTEKYEIIEQVYVIGNRTTFKFEHLDPKSYTFRVIYDTNENKRWDSGNFLQRIKPEKVIYFNKVIEIKALWEENEIFNLN